MQRRRNASVIEPRSLHPAETFPLQLNLVAKTPKAVAPEGGATASASSPSMRSDRHCFGGSPSSWCGQEERAPAEGVKDKKRCGWARAVRDVLMAGDFVSSTQSAAPPTGQRDQECLARSHCPTMAKIPLRGLESYGFTRAGI